MVFLRVLPRLYISMSRVVKQVELRNDQTLKAKGKVHSRKKRKKVRREEHTRRVEEHT